MRENDDEASVPTYGRRRRAPSSPNRSLPARPSSSLVGGGCTGCPPKSTQKSWPERTFGVLCQQLWSLVPFPKVQEKPQVHRSGDLSSGPGCSTPLPSSLHPALSLASPRSCFSQGQTPPTPAGDKLLWACGNFLPKPAGLTAQQQRWGLWPLSPPTPNQSKAGAGWGGVVETTLPATPGHSLPRPQKSTQSSKGGGGWTP